MKTLASMLLAASLILSAAYAADIVTVPTANQLKAGEVDVAYYYLGLDLPSAAPQSLQAQTIYYGLTDKVEIDLHRYDPESDKDKTSVIVNGTVLLLQESPTTPNVVLGVRNLTGETTTRAPINSDKVSLFVCAAKNVTPMTPEGPVLPLVRVHLGIGTEDWTLLGEKRHQGLFGGVQMLLHKEIGAVALYDGQDIITGVTYTPGNKGVTVKAGTFGKHWWMGISYAAKLTH